MRPKTKTPIGIAWIDDEGILWHRLDFGVKVTAASASRTVEVLADLLGDVRAPAIVDIGDVQFADRDAREVFAQLGAKAPEIATAIVVRSALNPVAGFLGDLFKELQSDRPIALFDSEAPALDWARTFLPAR